MSEKHKFYFKKYGSKTAIYVLLVLVALILVLPFVWTFFASVKSQSENISTTFKLLPEGKISEWEWSNYTVAIEQLNYFQGLKNTLMVAIPSVVFGIFSSAFIAYGFARFDFKYKQAIFLVLLASLMIPFEITMIPMYVIYSEIGWINTYLPMIVPAMFGSAQFIFFLTMYFISIPSELVASARVDGFTDLEIWRKIFLPISKPALVVVGIWAFQGAWNDLLGPLIWLTDSEMFTLQQSLAALNSATMTPPIEQGVIMAATMLITFPVLLVFLFTQRYILDTSKSEGIKG